MGTEDKRITLKIDINSGTIEIDAPVESFDQAISKTRELTDSLALGRGARGQGHSASSEAMKPEPTQPLTDTTNRERIRPKASKASSSTGRPGRLGSFEPVRELLSEDQQKAIRDFFAGTKSPKEQADEVLVSMYQGEKLLERQGFSYNEIYTLMWRAGVEPLPKALDVVVQKLMSDQLVEKGSSGYFLKFLGQSRVEKELSGAAEVNA